MLPHKSNTIIYIMQISNSGIRARDDVNVNQGE